jgi:hypothetical protein
VKQTRCNANRCVAASCVTGYSLCDESCAQCPTVGVGQTRCSGRQCVAAACASGFYPCGDGCCPWRLQTVFRGSGDSLGLALALDDAGLPRVAFVEESTHQLRYAEAEALPDGGLQWTVSLPSRPDAGVDLDPSLVLDRGGPVVAFHEQSTRTLFVARRAGGTWATTAVEIGGRWPALVAAASGGLRLAYGLSTSSGSALRYASEGPGGWSLSTVEPTGAEGVSAVLDGNGTPHLGYLAGGAELRYATASPALPSGWSVQRIDTGSSTCHTASVLGRSGSPRLLLPCTNAAVKLATQQTTGWRLETLVASTPFRRAGLAVDRRDRTWVVYGEGGKLVLAVEDPGMSPGWAKSAIATASVGSARLALSGSDRPIVLFWEQSLHELRVMW